MSFSPNPGATWKESVPSLAFISNWNVVVMERVADAMISFRLANLWPFVVYWGERERERGWWDCSPYTAGDVHSTRRDTEPVLASVHQISSSSNVLYVHTHSTSFWSDSWALAGWHRLIGCWHSVEAFDLGFSILPPRCCCWTERVCLCDGIGSNSIFGISICCSWSHKSVEKWRKRGIWATQFTRSVVRKSRKIIYQDHSG